MAAAWRIALVLGGAPLVAFAWAAVGEVLLAAIAIRFFASRLGFPRFRELVPHEAIRELLRECWPLALAGLAVAIYMKIDEVMLRFLIGAEAVGIYTAATRLTEVWYFLPAAIASSVLPALLRARDRGPQAYEARLQQYYDLNAAVAYAVAIPLALLSGWVVQIAYGPEFAGSAPIVSIHVWSLVFVFLGTARGQWLVNEKLQMFYLKATVSGAVVNIGLNFLLIPRWQGVGAAVATLVAQAVSSWVSSYASASTRGAARMQTRALFVPFLGARHLRATS